MHEDQPRLLRQHVTMNGSHFDAAGTQGLDYRIHLFGYEHEVTSYGGFTASGRLKVDCSGNSSRSGRSNLHSTFADGVSPRNTKLINAAVRLSLRPDDLIELGSI